MQFYNMFFFLIRCESTIFSRDFYLTGRAHKYTRIPVSIENWTFGLITRAHLFRTFRSFDGRLSTADGLWIQPKHQLLYHRAPCYTNGTLMCKTTATTNTTSRFVYISFPFVRFACIFIVRLYSMSSFALFFVGASLRFHMSSRPFIVHTRRFRYTHARAYTGSVFTEDKR